MKARLRRVRSTAKTLLFAFWFLSRLPLSAQSDAEDPRLTVHGSPKPLSPEAVTADWPRFLGPEDNCTSPETHLLNAFPETGPTLLWELEKEESYTCPAIVGNHLVHFHNENDEDVVECRDAVTGRLVWTHRYPNRYRDRYGYGKGPRAAPVIADGRVYTLSATSLLHCLDFTTGEVIWTRDLGADYSPGPYFFGHGPSPLVLAGKVIVPLGGNGIAVAAFEAATGETLWETEHEWKSSYASPVATTFHGQQRILVFAGGESRPPSGGLLCLDPDTGTLRDTFPWRATKFESVNASTPLLLPDNRVLLSETYEKGAALLAVDEHGRFDPVWKAPEFKLHWMTPIYQDGYLYAFTGRNEPDAGLDCWDAETGERKWREEFFWKKTVSGRSFGWSFFRGTLLRADGKVFALGELGTLAIFDLSPDGVEVTSQADLFSAQQSWVLPAVSKGLLYVVQNQRDLVTGKPPRLLCYDLRRREE